MTKTELISALRLCARKVEERDNVEIQLNIARRELAAVQAPPKLTHWPCPTASHRLQAHVLQILHAHTGMAQTAPPGLPSSGR